MPPNELAIREVTTSPRRALTAERVEIIRATTFAILRLGNAACRSCTLFDDGSCPVDRKLRDDILGPDTAADTLRQAQTACRRNTLA